MTPSTTQKALLLPEKQGQWIVGETSVPRPGPKDVLVKVLAAALNPVDWKIQTYGVFITEFPWIPGVDAAGVVEEVGAEVTGRQKGDKILFEGWMDNAHSAFQQYCIIPAELTARIPDNLSFDQAASVPLGLATAVCGFYNHFHSEAKSAKLIAPWEDGGSTAYAGKPILILGGASSVGQYAIQMAKLSSFSPIITTASPRNEELLKSLGATHVLDRSLPASELLAQIARLTGGIAPEIVYDAISLPDTQSLAYDALAPGGVLLLVLPENIPAEKKTQDDGKKVIVVMGNFHRPENRALGVELFKRLEEWLAKGWVKPNRVEVLPDGLAGVPGGLERMKNNQVSATKLIAHPQETQ
ncbi:GroES-like protein [Polyporus arcularius HHB13444]|uniref:GroES-like protein n=1 Tax=Polyporus arcularius HHB13444 TaxID=1314778 RepID=A0A5C3PBY2_9APHY|nr:GroES-like protein [Polyporus arcularius HHB13444]